MKYKNPLNQIKAILSKLDSSVEVKLAQMKLEDGVTIVEAESFEPEFSVGIVTEEGVVPMPVGEYVLEDGKVLVVEQEGIIAKVVEDQAQEPGPLPEAVVEPDMEAQPKKVVESVSKETFFEAELAKINVELAATIEANEKLKAEIESMKAENAKVELASANEPAAQAIVPNPESGEERQSMKFAQRRTKGLQDSVLSKMYHN